MKAIFIETLGCEGYLHRILKESCWQNTERIVHYSKLFQLIEAKQRSYKKDSMNASEISRILSDWALALEKDYVRKSHVPVGDLVKLYSKSGGSGESKSSALPCLA